MVEFDRYTEIKLYEFTQRSVRLLLENNVPVHVLVKVFSDFPEAEIMRIGAAVQARAERL